MKQEQVDCRRELARRVSGGLEITLYWRPDDQSTSIEIRQPATCETFAFAVAGERALEGFYHPFAHLPLRFDGPARTDALASPEPELVRPHDD
jgi:hypothetical protein